MNPKLITELDTVPIVSLETCWAHLRITPEDDSPPHHPDDELILAYLAAAREWVEGYTGVALTPRKLELALDTFPAGEIFLPTPPTVSVESVKYTDGDGVVQTVDPLNYVLDGYQRPGWLLPATGFSWPATKDTVNAVLIRYFVGYALWDESLPLSYYPLPKMLRSALLLLLGDLYENRENSSNQSQQEVPLGVKSLCDWVRVRKGMA